MGVAILVACAGDYRRLSCGPGTEEIAGECLPSATASGSGDSQFIRTLYDYPAELEVSDFDGDGDPDAVVSEFKLIELLLNEDGAIDAPEAARLPWDSYVYSLLAADLDGDGTEDLAGVSYSGERGILFVLLGDGSGAFTLAPGAAAFDDFDPLAAEPLAIGDLTGDGRLDVVTGGSVYAGDGAGGFEAWSSAPRMPAVADFDGDGDVDVLGVSGTGLVFGENTGGGFEFRDAGNGTLTDFALPADFDGDGDTDVVSPSDGRLVMYANVGSGVFEALTEISHRTSLSQASWVRALATDIDLDGDPDILVSAGFLDEDLDPCGGLVMILTNYGHGDFHESLNISDYPALDAAVADVDRDGDVDLLIASVEVESMSTYRGGVHVIQSIAREFVP